MHETGFNEKAKRPVNCWRRGFSALLAQARENLIGSDRHMALPNQLQDTPPQGRESQTAFTTQLFSRRHCGLNAVRVIVLSRRE